MQDVCTFRRTRHVFTLVEPLAVIAIIGILIVMLLFVPALGADGEGDIGKIPLFYSSDLHDPHRDPDDHFDLATLFALPEFDIRGMILDCGEKQVSQPGRTPLEQMMHLTGRKFPFAIGLENRLASPTDDGRNQPAKFQKGVALLLDVLRRSPRKVTIITTGSLRDVTAAFNREPGLFRKKVGRLYINVGNAAGHGRTEGNIRRCKQSYVGIMRSGLPVYWCPCQDGDGDWHQTERGYSTHWAFEHHEVLESSPVGLQNFFIYALTKQKEVDPIAFLSKPQDPSARARIWKLRRNMWCTASFFHAAGRRVVEVAPGRWAALPAVSTGQRVVEPYDFLPVRVTIDDQSNPTLDFTRTGDGHDMHVFKRLDQAGYNKIMTSCLRKLLARIPTAR